MDPFLEARVSPKNRTPTSRATNDVLPYERHESYTRDVKTLLLRGGITLRCGPWLVDDEEGFAAQRWGSAAVVAWEAFGETLGKISSEEKEKRWAIEVGWFVNDGDGCGDSESSKAGGLRSKKRELLTIVLDTKTMEPLGAWKGSERRPVV